jgi:lipopolysaccharide assembly outer membrane protein LptD (OstA)|tara:strand:+ start:123 stop:635 length:513 start_codon:yes stop_codon:yes gene_type:complete
MIFFVLIFLMGCAETGEEVARRNTSMFNENEIENPEIIISRENTRIVKAVSKHLMKNGNEDALLTGNVKADFYNDLGEHVSILYSDSAKINQRTNNLRATGNVHVESDSGFTLYANSILWDNQYKIIESKDSVMFTTIEGDTMYGVGFESDMDLTKWKIYKPNGVIKRDF